MSVQHIYMDTDVCKASQYGSITPTPTSFNFSLNGSAYMYLDADIEYNDDPSVTFNPKLNMRFTLDGTNITSSPPSIDNSLTLRFTIKIYNQSRTQVYSQQYTPSNNSGAYYWNPYQSYTLYGRTGEYGNITGGTQVQCAHGMSGNLSISLPSSIYGQEFFFVVEVEKYYRYSSPEWSYCGATREYHTYAPFRISVTAPSNVYINGLNSFLAEIEAKYYSKLSMKLTCENNGSPVSITDIDQPVRNENYPYITQGTHTYAVYWNGGCYVWKTGGFTNFRYSLIIELEVTDPSNSSFKVLASKTTKSGDAEIRSQDDFTAYSTDITITDLAGYYDQFGVMLRNTNSVIRATVSATLRYGANARAYIVKFGATNYTLIANMDRTADVVYDQYVPATGTTGTTRCFISVYGYELDTETFSASIVNYSAPSYTNLSVHRCNQDGTANDNGGYVKIEWGVMIVSINDQNAKALIIDHPQGRQSYNPLDDYVMSGELIVEADTDSSYNIVFMLSDSIYNGSNAITRSIQLSTAGVIMDWLFGGRGVSFGKVAEMEYALEVGQNWDLVAYKMLLNNVDVVQWIKEMASRMDAIEQFAANIGSTSQFQVTFYNGYDLLERQWVLLNGDATEPEEVPYRESTNTRTYSFVGWTLTQGSSTADPNALKNIQSYRSIYAAFLEAVRYYTVGFYNGSTLLRAFNEVEYQGVVPYTQYSDLSPTPPEGGTFVGWMPSGRYVEKSEKAIAQFYFDQEIEDEWEDIVAACADGTYKDKYKMGNWKMLDLGTQGEIKMRIKGFDMHFTSGMHRTHISWEADNQLATKHRMNPALVKTIEEDAVDGWDYQGQRVVNSKYAYRLQINENATSSNKGVATIVVTALQSVTIYTYHNNYTFNGVTIYRDGTREPYVQDYNYSTTVDVSLSAGQTTTFEVDGYLGNTETSADGKYFYIYERTNPSSSSSKISVQCTVNKIDEVVGYQYGEIGGFGASELCSWLQTDIKLLLPEVLRLGIMRARLTQRGVRSKTEPPYYEYIDSDTCEADIFIPSTSEIVGKFPWNSKGVDFDVWKYQYRKKENINASNANAYWCRDAADNYKILNEYRVISGYAETDRSAGISSKTVTTALPVYICFCT